MMVFEAFCGVLLIAIVFLLALAVSPRLRQKTNFSISVKDIPLEKRFERQLKNGQIIGFIKKSDTVDETLKYKHKDALMFALFGVLLVTSFALVRPFANECQTILGVSPFIFMGLLLWLISFIPIVSKIILLNRVFRVEKQQQYILRDAYPYDVFQKLPFHLKQQKALLKLKKGMLYIAVFWPIFIFFLFDDVSKYEGFAHWNHHMQKVCYADINKSSAL